MEDLVNYDVIRTPMIIVRSIENSQETDGDKSTNLASLTKNRQTGNYTQTAKRGIQGYITTPFLKATFRFLTKKTLYCTGKKRK